MRAFRYVLTVLAIVSTGCRVPNRSYRTHFDSVITVPPMAAIPAISSSLPAAHPGTSGQCNESSLLTRPCLAFLEFDEFGERWQTSAGGRPTQLTRAIALIERARRQDPTGQPVILTFVHGWKHNASGAGGQPEDTNVTGMKAVLNDLQATLPHPHVVIGIYIAWRGQLISPYWPVANTLSVYNREAAAGRVGNSSMTDALIEIADKARAPVRCRENDVCVAKQCISRAMTQQGETVTDPACQGLVLFVGHSFGALVLEKALSQATITRMEREYNNAIGTEASDNIDSQSRHVTVTPLADLVIYINSAATALASKQIMDYLAESHFTYRPERLEKNGDEPLFLSVTSAADTVTGVYLTVGHALPWLAYKAEGSLRDKSAQQDRNIHGGLEATDKYARVCFDPATRKSDYRTDLSQGSYFLSTTAHQQKIWSHMLSAPLPAAAGVADPSCQYVGGATVYSSCTIAQHRYDVLPVDGRCNGTPYWAMEVPKEFIPDHGTIFTQRLIEFLRPFISTPERRALLHLQMARPASAAGPGD